MHQQFFGFTNLNIFLDSPFKSRNTGIQSQRFFNAAFKILQIRNVFLGAIPFRISEFVLEFDPHSLLFK